MVVTFIFSLFKWDIFTFVVGFEEVADGGGDGGEPRESDVEPLPGPDQVRIPDYVDV